MKRAYWDQVAGNYETEIFSVAAQDRAGRVRRVLTRYGRGAATVSDIGCGIGHFLPLLAARFAQVLAVDLSPRCLARARARHAALTNVRYVARDLSAPGTRLPAADLVLCVNALLTPALAVRHRFLDNLCRSVRRGGHLVLVVPSLESALLTNARLIEWNRRNGLGPSAAARSGFNDRLADVTRRLHEGVARIDHVETKHYLAEELAFLLADRGLVVCETTKIEYPWRTEFTNPPRWMRAPYPWDWLVVARRPAAGAAQKR